MKIGIILFVMGVILITLLLKVKFTKDMVKNVGVVVGVLFVLYGLILIVQPNDDNFIQYTKTTISKTTK